MSVAFYMTELTTPKPIELVAWYVAALGLHVELTDAAGGFTLLTAPNGGRLAIKPGEPGRVTLHFCVEDLDVAEARLRAAGVEPGDGKASAEGYRRLAVVDPVGNRVVVFMWEQAEVISDVRA